MAILLLSLLLLLLLTDHTCPLMNSRSKTDSQLGGDCSRKLATALSVLASWAGVNAAAWRLHAA
jgi:hypothetical protein